VKGPEFNCHTAQKKKGGRGGGEEKEKKPFRRKHSRKVLGSRAQ
jgi:hypothetical protein